MAQQEVNEHLIKLLQDNSRSTFRQLMVLSNLNPQDIWDSLVELQSQHVVESIHLSRKKSGWQLQRWYTNTNRPHTPP